MRAINKQKFLTELGRLLTFMYEEDRERALALYSSLFDETDDETGVLQMLVSPTRQAVNLARAYDARERKLQVQAQSRGEAPEADEPAFVQVIEKLRVQAAALGAPVNKVSADQFSLFEDAAKESSLFDEVEPAPEPAPEPAVQTDLFFDIPSPPAAEPAPIEAESAESPVPDTAEAPAFDPAEAVLDNFAMPDEEPAQAEAAAPAPAMKPAPAPVQEEWSGSMPGARPAPVPPPFPESEKPEEPALSFTQSMPAPQPPVQTPAPQPERPRSEILAGSRPLFTKSKPRVGLLILFLLFAVPITLLCILLLLAPAALALGVGAFAGWLGVTGLLATFGSFSVFADILLVFGCTLIVLALAVLFLWIFIWLIFGVIPGLIRGVCALARKWCYKEVPVS